MKVFANTLKPAAVSTHHSTQLSDVKLYFCQEKKHNTNEPVAEHREKKWQGYHWVKHTETRIFFEI